MNREEVNWLLQTIKDAKNAERFVLAQYECGRISFRSFRRCSLCVYTGEGQQSR